MSQKRYSVHFLDINASIQSPTTTLLVLRDPDLAGAFNVPIGTKNSVLLPTDNFEKWSEVLRRSEIVVSDFEVAFSKCGQGDFVFADPPYVTTHANNGFIKYNENLFTWEDQKRLAAAAHSAVARGATVIISNSNHRSIRALYRQYDARFKMLARPSVIAAKSEHRRSVREILVIMSAGLGANHFG